MSSYRNKNKFLRSLDHPKNHELNSTIKNFLYDLQKFTNRLEEY